MEESPEYSENNAQMVSKEEIEQQTKLEQARESAINAEIKREKMAERKEAKERGREKLAKIPRKVKIVLLAVLLVLLLVLFGIVFPLAFGQHENQYFSESDLKRATNIEELSTVEYIYDGIAEKDGRFLWAETVDYRVRYTASIKAYCDMTQIEFTKDDETGVVTARLPRIQISAPVIDDDSLSFLPENANANIKDVLEICKEDAANDMDADSMRQEAISNLKDIVKGLTEPILGDEWTLEFEEPVPSGEVA